MQSSHGSYSNCPFCKAKGEFFAKTAEIACDEQFAIHKCSSCCLCYTYPRPSSEVLTKIYTDQYWFRENKKSTLNTRVRLVQLFNTLRLAAMVKPLTNRLQPGDKILEVGCGSGQLAVYLKRCGFDVEVTDINRDLLREIYTNHGINGYCGDLPEMSFPPHLYKAIIFNNVLEHLVDPTGNLLRVHDLLARDGFVFVEVPNIDSFQYRIFKESWFPLQIPEHLFHFTPASLQGVMQQCGMERVWASTFSPRISAAGYVASLFPSLQPDKLHRFMSKRMLVLYLGLQIVFYPMAYIDSLWGKGSAVRVIYQPVNKQ